MIPPPPSREREIAPPISLAGTNDFFFTAPKGSRSPLAVADRLRGLLNATFAQAPTTTVLLSTVTPINEERCKQYNKAPWHPGDCPSDMQANIAAFNALIPSVAAEYRQRGLDVAVHDVGREAQFSREDYWIWGIHFNTSGFFKMARSWHKAIRASAPVVRRQQRAAASKRVDAPALPAACGWGCTGRALWLTAV